MTGQDAKCPPEQDTQGPPLTSLISCSSSCTQACVPAHLCTGHHTDTHHTCTHKVVLNEVELNLLNWLSFKRFLRTKLDMVTHIGR